MRRTGVSDENGLFLGHMVALSKGFTWVDGVFEVEAAADRVPFNDLVAHGDDFRLGFVVVIVTVALQDRRQDRIIYEWRCTRSMTQRGKEVNERQGYY